jgi:putative transposase
MDEFESLSHTKWDCKYHIVFIPKYRRKVLCGQLRARLGEISRNLAAQKESRIEEGKSLVIGYIKGKSAIHLARVYGERRRNYVGQHFWARGYFVSTVGRDETVIRDYIKNQEKEDQRLEQLHLGR